MLALLLVGFLAASVPREVLPLASTLAGNLLIVGSIANMIVVEQASSLGVHISWRDHSRVGVPVTVTTLLVAALWLLVRAG